MSSIVTEQSKAIARALSHARMSTYERAAGCRQGSEKAIELYTWNAQVSAALMHPLHVCEVIIRNAVAEVLSQKYGEQWPWSQGFEQSLPNPGPVYSPTRDLQAVRNKFQKTSEVIPELKFVFWQMMFTKRHDGRLWNQHLKSAFPNLPNQPTKENRSMIHADLESVRKLRNRVAHHEPLLQRNLNDDLNKIHQLIEFRCSNTKAWVEKTQSAMSLIQARP